MAKTLSTSLKAYISAAFVKGLDLTNAQDPLVVNEARSLSSGSGANQANASWHDRRTLTQSQSEDLDLSGTALKDAFGDNVALARVKAIYVKNNGTASTLQIGGDANSIPIFGAVADYLILRPGGSVLLMTSDATAYAVTVDTGDILQITHGGEDAADLTYDIVIIGATS